MEEIQKQLAAVVVPAVLAGLVGLITGGFAFAKAWLDRRTARELREAMQDQAARSAVKYVEALTSEREDLTSAQKRMLAMDEIDATLAPRNVTLSAEKLGALVEKHGPEVVPDFGKRSSRPPPDEAAKDAHESTTLGPDDAA